MFSVRPLVSRNLRDLCNIVSTDDYVISLLNKSKLRSFAEFISWPGAGAREIYRYVLTLPKEQRALHAVFGREGVPLDFCADLDLPLSPSDPHAQQQGQLLMEATCDETERTLQLAYGKQFSKLVVLQSFAVNKLSYHIHARIAEDVAFQDISDLCNFSRIVARSLKLRWKKEVLDSGIYRTGGQLRLYDCVKSIGDDATLDKLALKRPLHWNPCPDELFELSLVTRPRSVVRELITSKSTAPVVKMEDSYDNCMDFVIKTVPRLEESVAHAYSSWIQIGLALKSLHLVAQSRPDGVLFDFEDLFHTFSAKSPKYSRGDCDRQWARMKVRDADWLRAVRCVRRFCKKNVDMP